MTKINDLSQGNLGETKRQQHRDRYATPLNGSSVGHGGQRFYGTGKLTVENEGLYVIGVADISGTLNGSGTFNWAGDVNVTGPTKLDGPTTVGADLKIVAGGLFKAGATEIRPDGSAKFGLFDIAANGDLSSKGKLSIEDTTTLKADLNVTTGKVKVGSLTIEPASGGQLNFTNGAISRSGTFGMLINDATRVELAAPSVKLSGTNLTATSLPTTTQKANLYADPATGKIYRSTAA